MPLAMPTPGNAMGTSLPQVEDQTAMAVTNRFTSASGRRTFHAIPISWSTRTRGSVPRSQTATATKM